MSKIIAIINQKGGVAKSTTAAALLAGLNAKGYKALAIDIDAQCNLSLITGAETTGGTILGVLAEEIPAVAAIQHTPQGDVIAAHRGLAGADGIMTDTGKEYKLKEALESLYGLYDYIVIDTPPALGVLTINALTAADTVVIPAQADLLSLQGIEGLYSTITTVKKYCNHRLAIAGILLTRYNARNILTAEVTALMETLAAKMGTKVFAATIREAIAVKEAQIQQRSLFDYAPRAKVTADYTAFIAELLQNVSEGNNEGM